MTLGSASQSQKKSRNFKLARAVGEDQCLALFLKQIYNEWPLIQRLKANIIKIIQGLPNYLLHKFNLSENSFPQSSRVMTAGIDVYFYGPTKLHFAQTRPEFKHIRWRQLFPIDNSTTKMNEKSIIDAICRSRKSNQN